MSLGITALRIVTGATMAAHGLSKLSPSVGEGPDQTGGSFEKMGISPGKQMGMTTAVAETAGGALMVAGLGTPWACAAISGVMIGAIAKVHLKNGFWTSEGGFEYNLNILGATFAVAGAGGGALTLDGLRRKKKVGVHWALLQLALGAAGAAGALALAERQSASSALTGSGLSASTLSADGARPDEDVQSLVDLAEDDGSRFETTSPGASQY